MSTLVPLGLAAIALWVATPEAAFIIGMVAGGFAFVGGVISSHA